MKGLCWTGVNKLAVETVPDPQIPTPRTSSSRSGSPPPADRTCTCWSATFRRCGPATSSATSSWARSLRSVRRGAATRPGDRVVVCPFIACGRCWYCEQKLYSLCDNGNPSPPSRKRCGATRRRLLRVLARHGRLRGQPRGIHPGAVRRPVRARRRPAQGWIFTGEETSRGIRSRLPLPRTSRNLWWLE
jgi:hypothetical protein